MRILGLVNIEDKSHDNGIALIHDQEIIFAESGERASRIKHDDSVPTNTIKRMLKILNLDISKIDYFAVGTPKFNWWSLILARNYGFDTFLYVFNLFIQNPKIFMLDFKTRVNRFLTSHSKSNINKGIHKLFDSYNIDRNKIIYVDHQQSHAASAYYSSGINEKCLAISLDGCGPNKDGKIISGGVYLCENGKMTLVSEVPCYSTFGGLYSAVTYVLGFRPGDGEFKTMGLSSFGEPTCYEEIKKLAPYIKNGNYHSTRYWVDFYSVMNSKVFEKTRLYKLLISLKKKHSEKNLAASLQKVLEENVIELLEYFSKKYNIKNFSCAGGVFLNIKMNKKIVEKKFIEKFHVYPNASDAGIPAGAAYVLFESKKKLKPKKIENLYLGNWVTEEEIIRDIKLFGNKIKYEKYDDFKKQSKKISEILISGKVVGLFQGRAEWGPRALGNRSVLADPRDKNTKDRINSFLKDRDWFMPFGPSALSDYYYKYLDDTDVIKKSFLHYFMLTTFDVKEKKAFPAAMHVDNTSRVHVVKRDLNPNYYDIINDFYNQTGCPYILNTSFNKHGLPIVDSAKDAIEHLLDNCIEVLSIENYIIYKNE